MKQFWRILKVSIGSLLLLAALVGMFHFWVIVHAKNILSEIVTKQSKGRYQLEVKKLEYNYLKLKLELQQPVLKNVDTSKNSDKFELHAQLISLQLEKFWPLIFGRHLLIDSILMDRPFLSLQHQKRNISQKQLTTFSLSDETEKLYQSIQSVLTTLKVANFRINDGTFSLNNTLQKNALPLEIKNINFYIKGFNIDSSTVSQHPKSYTEDIQLRIGGQTINFPDGNKSIKFSSFHFVANNGDLEVDSCSISGGENDSTKASFNLFAEKMRIKNVYLAGNDTADYNRIDSLFFTRPKVSFSVQIKDTKQDSSETISSAVQRITSAAFGRLLVRYASINNVNFDIEVERKEKVSTFNFVQDSLVLSNLGVGLFPSMPLSAASIRFGVKEFVDYFRDSTYIVHFDSVRINNDQFLLFNFNVASTARVKKGQQKVFIPILQIQGIDWYQLISQKKLVASNLTLNDPAISIVAAGESKNKKLKKNNSVDRLLRQTFELKNINILNGTVNYAFADSGTIAIKKINTSLQPQFWVPGYIPSIQKTIRQFNTGELVYFKDGWKLTAENMTYGEENAINAGSIDLTNSLQNLHIRASDVTLAGLKAEAKSNSLYIKRIDWVSANILMNLTQKSGSKSNSSLTLGSIDGGTTELKLFNDSTNINAKISKIKTGDIVIINGKPEELHNLSTEGTSIDVTTENKKFHSGKFIIKDRQPSELNSVTASFPVSKRMLTLSLPQVNFEMNVQQSLSNPFDVSWLNIVQPRIDINVNQSDESTSHKEEKLFPGIHLKKILITDPVISFQNNIGKQSVQMKLGKSYISAAEIKTIDNGSGLKLNDLQIQSNEFSVDHTDSMKIFSSNGTVKIAVNAFTLYSRAVPGNGKWQLSQGSIDLSNLTLLNIRKSSHTDTLQLSSLHLNDLSLNENSLYNPGAYFNSGPLFTINNLNFFYRDQKNRIRIKALKATYNSVTLDSFSFRPQMNRFAFMASHTFQTDYITLETGPVYINNIGVTSWLKDSIINVGNIHITHGVLNDTRDKQLPLQLDIVKGLPVTLIKNFPIKTKIDSITISNGVVRYHEISEKTKLQGNMRFTRLNGTIQNVKNYDLKNDDSLYVQATGYLMDSAYATMRMRESYYDSLATFPITIRSGRFDLKILNPFLLPVMSVRIKSGIADSILLKAVGKEYLSLGELLFLYHDLKVEFLKDGDEQKKTLLTSLITFAANSFAIRNNNTKRIGTVIYERSRNRSFFNYLVRMIASGAASSVGAKRNKKYIRIYKDKIREQKLPE